MSNFGNHIVSWPADFLTTGIGHHAESAVLTAAFHDGYERRGAIGAWIRQVVELFDFRETHIHYTNAVTFHTHFGDHIRQAVQGLRAKDHIDIRRPVDNGLAFLTGDTATDTNDQIRFLRFQFFPAAQLMKDLLLGFFTDGAGIQQQNIRVVRGFGHLYCFAGFKQVGHAG